jgi:hypothetical protein
VQEPGALARVLPGAAAAAQAPPQPEAVLAARAWAEPEPAFPKLAAARGTCRAAVLEQAKLAAPARLPLAAASLKQERVARAKWFRVAPSSTKS